ncbi:hypothetical protein BgiBS90_008639 [Biomphalaria glabrata]|nr:hypothetical protein BgiBS90_008639 [Biomphalaria glabrata]
MVGGGVGLAICEMYWGECVFVQCLMPLIADMCPATCTDGQPKTEWLDPDHCRSPFMATKVLPDRTSSLTWTSSTISSFTNTGEASITSSP